MIAVAAIVASVWTFARRGRDEVGRFDRPLQGPVAERRIEQRLQVLRMERVGVDGGTQGLPGYGFRVFLHDRERIVVMGVRPTPGLIDRVDGAARAIVVGIAAYALFFGWLKSPRVP